MAWIKCKALFRLLLLTAIFSFHQTNGADAKPATRLNLLIITADDMNADSWFNRPVSVTPKLDAFARTAYRFEHCHVTAPICQPSRSALMTGRVPHRNGALGFNPINLDVPTLTEVLSSNGYFTAALNKTSHMAPPSKFKWDLDLAGSGKNPQVMRDQMAQCLHAAADLKKPFFINANITDPHRPFAGARPQEQIQAKPKRRAAAKSNEANASAVKAVSPQEVSVPGFLEDIPDVRREVAQYYTSVRRLDEIFAEILAALKTSGQFEKTLIVFLSDHGMSFPFAKATLYRNGTWSPILFKWPGSKTFHNTTDMVSSVDVMPTVLELMQIEKPSSMDGRSLAPLLQGDKLPNTDHVFTHVNSVSSGNNFAGRCIRTRKRAYIWNAWPDGKTRYKVEAMGGLSFAALVKDGATNPKTKERVNFWLHRTAEEFYDEEKDPHERTNLIHDSAYQKEIAAMKKQLLAHMEKTNDPLLEQFRKVAGN